MRLLFWNTQRLGSGFHCEVRAIDTRGIIPKESMSDHLPILIGVAESL